MEYLDEHEAAAMLRRKLPTIRTWRHLNKGPKFNKDPQGKVWYKESDIIEFIGGGSQEAENRMEK